MREHISFTYLADIYHALIELAEIADSFDQLTKIALIGDALCFPGDTEHKALYKVIEGTSRRLRSLPVIDQEVKKDDIPPTFYFGNFSNKG